MDFPEKSYSHTLKEDDDDESSSDLKVGSLQLCPGGSSVQSMFIWFKFFLQFSNSSKGKDSQYLTEPITIHVSLF